MFTGLSPLYENRAAYCALVVARDKCKWYEIFKKQAIKEDINWFYPKMRNETKLSNK